MESIEKQVTVLMQGLDFGDPQIKETMTKELRQRLIEVAKEGRPLEVYNGYDVTAPDLHLGHIPTIHKLRQFQDFGHHITFVIGTFTTLIGDPSDRDEARGSVPTMEQIEKNAKTYADQAFKILDRQKTTVRFNHEWLNKLTFADVIKGASYFTVQQMLARDRLRKRWDANKPLGLHELLYALAQGYDALHLHADVQTGGVDQLFNLMTGRRLQEAYGQKPLVCITTPMLPGTDGGEKMSKSLGNYIAFTEAPEQQYGKLMSIPDNLIMQYFEVLTDISATELAHFKQAMANNTVNPMELKKRLAKEIVTLLNNEQAAAEAEAYFARTVQKKEVPDDIKEFELKEDTQISRLLVDAGMAPSRSEASRLIQQGAVSIGGKKFENAAEVVSKNASKGSVVKVGKRGYFKIK